MKGLTYCGLLAIAVLDWIEKRLGHLRGKRELIVASCLIPRFKLLWMPDSSMRDQATINIKTELASVTKPASTDAAISPAPKDSFGHQALPAGAQDELSRYLLVSVDYPLSEMKKFEGLHKLFLKYNTAVASVLLTKKRKVLASGRCAASVWAAMSRQGLGPLVLMDGKRMASKYALVIEQELVPYILDGPFKYWRCIFPHFRSPIHSARNVKSLLYDLRYAHWSGHQFERTSKKP
ncbi:hypothetical protein HPB50_011326 [Hyalomma asiaticum]|uniref:Uncharacterized protein n=1 Tax=Hyalomma asiaticum TaxID=266040 RepID=A0ACB7SQ41_HYAAI|nr:hypothetical protein HPB50_011326 [Hyalomma asiaticum]